MRQPVMKPRGALLREMPSFHQPAPSSLIRQCSMMKPFFDPDCRSSYSILIAVPDASSVSWSRVKVTREMVGTRSSRKTSKCR